LKGSAITLKEPFAVLRKRKTTQNTEMSDKDETTSESALKSHSGTQLEVVGVVKTKLMFDQYPKSIMR
jgi:hypothetical protein